MTAIGQTSWQAHRMGKFLKFLIGNRREIHGIFDRLSLEKGGYLMSNL